MASLAHPFILDESNGKANGKPNGHAVHTDNAAALRVRQRGGWLPKDYNILHDWLTKLITEVDQHHRERGLLPDLDPTIQAFQQYVDNTPRIRALAQAMFTQVPNKPPYNNDPTGRPQVRDYHHMFQLIDAILKRAPAWDSVADKVGLVGFPINAILDWPMGTCAGYEFFRDKTVNQHFAKVLQKWSVFLGSPDSAYVLNDGANGWLSPTVLAKLEEKGNVGITKLTFDQLYVCSPTEPHYGFKSWDNFFTRVFRPSVRPVFRPDDNRCIVNACESSTYRLRKNVALSAEFNLKGQPYSLQDMLDNDPDAVKFVGGWVYQAFLSALTYHRWHSPVNGTIVKTKVVPGTYYSESVYQGFASGNPDPSAPNNSQGYIANVATRALIWIQADDPRIGLVCIIPIGMAEVSSCEITVRPGDRVNKGDQIGMFHFGGSTYCMLLQPGVHVQWRPTSLPEPYNNRVNDWLAVVGDSEEDAHKRAQELLGQA